MNDTPELLSRIRALFEEAAFVQDLGIQVDAVRSGQVETSLRLSPRHLQQDGYAHAGVLATMADHTAGGAALSVAPSGHRVLSIEFKVNLLRPAQGTQLRCVATVLKAGKRITVAEAEVFCGGDEGGEKLVSKATVTLALNG